MKTAHICFWIADSHKVKETINFKEIKKVNKKVIQVTCVPLYSILLALGNPTVDFFSLDIEGAEVPVLEAMPWSQVKIKVRQIKIKVTHVPEANFNHQKPCLENEGILAITRSSAIICNWLEAPNRQGNYPFINY